MEVRELAEYKENESADKSQLSGEAGIAGWDLIGILLAGAAIIQLIISDRLTEVHVSTGIISALIASAAGILMVYMMMNERKGLEWNWAKISPAKMSVFSDYRKASEELLDESISRIIGIEDEHERFKEIADMLNDLAESKKKKMKNKKRIIKLFSNIKRDGKYLFTGSQSHEFYTSVKNIPQGLKILEKLFNEKNEIEEKEIYQFNGTHFVKILGSGKTVEKIIRYISYLKREGIVKGAQVSDIIQGSEDLKTVKKYMDYLIGQGFTEKGPISMIISRSISRNFSEVKGLIEYFRKENIESQSRQANIIKSPLCLEEVKHLRNINISKSNRVTIKGHAHIDYSIEDIYGYAKSLFFFEKLNNSKLVTSTKNRLALLNVISHENRKRLGWHFYKRITKVVDEQLLEEIEKKVSDIITIEDEHERLKSAAGLIKELAEKEIKIPEIRIDLLSSITRNGKRLFDLNDKQMRELAGNKRLHEKLDIVLKYFDARIQMHKDGKKVHKFNGSQFKKLIESSKTVEEIEEYISYLENLQDKPIVIGAQVVNVVMGSPDMKTLDMSMILLKKHGVTETSPLSMIVGKLKSRGLSEIKEFLEYFKWEGIKSQYRKAMIIYSPLKLDDVKMLRNMQVDFNRIIIKGSRNIEFTYKKIEGYEGLILFIEELNKRKMIAKTTNKNALLAIFSKDTRKMLHWYYERELISLQNSLNKSRRPGKRSLKYEDIISEDNIDSYGNEKQDVLDMLTLQKIKKVTGEGSFYKMLQYLEEGEKGDSGLTKEKYDKLVTMIRRKLKEDAVIDKQIFASEKKQGISNIFNKSGRSVTKIMQMLFLLGFDAGIILIVCIPLIERLYPNELLETYIPAIAVTVWTAVAAAAAISAGILMHVRNRRAERSAIGSKFTMLAESVSEISGKLNSLIYEVAERETKEKTAKEYYSELIWLTVQFMDLTGSLKPNRRKSFDKEIENIKGRILKAQEHAHALGVYDDKKFLNDGQLLKYRPSKSFTSVITVLSIISEQIRNAEDLISRLGEINPEGIEKINIDLTELGRTVISIDKDYDKIMYFYDKWVVPKSKIFDKGMDKANISYIDQVKITGAISNLTSIISTAGKLKKDLEKRITSENIDRLYMEYSRQMARNAYENGIKIGGLRNYIDESLVKEGVLVKTSDGYFLNPDYSKTYGRSARLVKEYGQLEKKELQKEKRIKMDPEKLEISRIKNRDWVSVRSEVFNMHKEIFGQIKDPETIYEKAFEDEDFIYLALRYEGKIAGSISARPLENDPIDKVLAASGKDIKKIDENYGAGNTYYFGRNMILPLYRGNMAAIRLQAEIVKYVYGKADYAGIVSAKGAMDKIGGIFGKDAYTWLADIDDYEGTGETWEYGRLDINKLYERVSWLDILKDSAIDEAYHFNIIKKLLLTGHMDIRDIALLNAVKLNSSFIDAISKKQDRNAVLKEIADEYTRQVLKEKEEKWGVKIKISRQYLDVVVPSIDSYLLGAARDLDGQETLILHQSILNTLSRRGPPRGYSVSSFLDLAIKHILDNRDTGLSRNISSLTDNAIRVFSDVETDTGIIQQLLSATKDPVTVLLKGVKYGIVTGIDDYSGTYENIDDSIHQLINSKDSGKNFSDSLSANLILARYSKKTASFYNKPDGFLQSIRNLLSSILPAKEYHETISKQEIVRNAKHIILDMEGVVLDNIEILRETAAYLHWKIVNGIQDNSALKPSRKDLAEASKYLSNNVGVPTWEMIPRWIDKAGEMGIDIKSLKTADEYYEEYKTKRKINLDKVLENDPNRLLMKGMETLFDLQQAGAVKLYIVSAVREEEKMYLLEELGIKDYFQEIRMTGGIEGKPEAVRQLISKHKIDMEDVVFVDDSLTSIKNVRAALGKDLTIIGVPSVKKQAGSIKKLADMVFPGLAEFAQYKETLIEPMPLTKRADMGWFGKVKLTLSSYTDKQALQVLMQNHEMARILRQAISKDKQYYATQATFIDNMLGIIGKHKYDTHYAGLEFAYAVKHIVIENISSINEDTLIDLSDPEDIKVYSGTDAQRNPKFEVELNNGLAKKIEQELSVQLKNAGERKEASGMLRDNRFFEDNLKIDTENSLAVRVVDTTKKQIAVYGKLDQAEARALADELALKKWRELAGLGDVIVEFTGDEIKVRTEKDDEYAVGELKEFARRFTRIVVISDTHMSDKQEGDEFGQEKEQNMIHILDKVIDDRSALIINGDLMNYWIVNDLDKLKAYGALFEKLRQVRKIVYIRGNHDRDITLDALADSLGDFPNMSIVDNYQDELNQLYVEHGHRAVLKDVPAELGAIKSLLKSASKRVFRLKYSDFGKKLGWHLLYTDILHVLDTIPKIIAPKIYGTNKEYIDRSLALGKMLKWYNKKLGIDNDRYKIVFGHTHGYKGFHPAVDFGQQHYNEFLNDFEGINYANSGSWEGIMDGRPRQEWLELEYGKLEGALGNDPVGAFDEKTGIKEQKEPEKEKQQDIEPVSNISRSFKIGIIAAVASFAVMAMYLTAGTLLEYEPVIKTVSELMSFDLYRLPEAVIGLSIFEETVFRAGLFGYLNWLLSRRISEKTSFLTAALVASTVFAYGHPGIIIPAFIFGMIQSYVYKEEGFIAAVVSHGVFNLLYFGFIPNIAFFPVLITGLILIGIVSGKSIYDIYKDKDLKETGLIARYKENPKALFMIGIMLLPVILINFSLPYEALAAKIAALNIYGITALGFAVAGLFVLKDRKLNEKYMKEKTVVALGGNAFNELPDMADSIVELIKRGSRITITHGNGPQVGDLLEVAEKNLRENSVPIPSFADLVKKTQDEMGQEIVAILTPELEKAGIIKEIEVINTHIIVDKNDFAFKKYSKPVGARRYTEEEKKNLEEQFGWVLAKDPSRDISETDQIYRRVVASPAPLKILQADLDRIKKAVEAGKLVVAVGGGGIPVIETDKGLKGVDAVIDKDLASAMLAKELGADNFTILTDVDKLKRNFKLESEKDISSLTIPKAEKFLDERRPDGELQASTGGMGPKLRAAILAAKGGISKVIITNGKNTIDAVYGNAGFRIKGHINENRRILFDGRFVLGSQTGKLQLVPRAPPLFKHADVEILRHGETDWNVKMLAQGRSDTELNEDGIEQAKTAARRYYILNEQDIKSGKLPAIITSPLKRAQQTATIIRDHIYEKTGVKLEIHTDDRAMEASFGDWEGKSVLKLASEFPGIFGRMKDGSDFNIRFPGKDGESQLQMLERAYRLAKDIDDKYAGRKVLVVSHGHFINSMGVMAGDHRYIDDQGYANVMKYIPANCEIIRFTDRVTLNRSIKRFIRMAGGLGFRINSEGFWEKKNIEREIQSSTSEEVIRYMTRILKDNSKTNQRYKALKVLGEIALRGSKHTKDITRLVEWALIEFTSRENTVLSEGASQILIQLKAPDTIPALIKALKENPNERVRANCAEALGEIGIESDEVIAALRGEYDHDKSRIVSTGAIEDSFWQTRIKAYQALEKIYALAGKLYEPKVSRSAHIHELSKQAAQLVSDRIRSFKPTEAKPYFVLGLPCDGTSRGMYEELKRMHRDEGLSFKNVITFNLDEYIGLYKGHDQSYMQTMFLDFFMNVDIPYKNINFPDAHAGNMQIAARRYEQKIKEAGGIDLQILGIGVNGHIAFDEPETSLNSRTMEIALTDTTIQSNKRFFNNIHEVPKHALTMGIGTIMDSKEIILLANGEHKAQAIRDALEGNITPKMPASFLRYHPNVTFFIDRHAASALKERSPPERTADVHAEEEHAHQKPKYKAHERPKYWAALINGLSLLGMSGLILTESISRFTNIEQVMGKEMLPVVAGGLAVNIIAFLVFLKSSKSDINVRGVFVHAIGDGLASIAAGIAGFLIWKFGWYWSDPAASLVIVAIILKYAISIIVEARKALKETKDIPREKIPLKDIPAKTWEILRNWSVVKIQLNDYSAQTDKDSHEHSHDHGHDHGHHHHGLSSDDEINTDNWKKLLFVCTMTAGYMVVEFIYGYIFNSVALISDAGHMLADAGSHFIALAAQFFTFINIMTMIKTKEKKTSKEKDFSLKKRDVEVKDINSAIENSMMKSRAIAFEPGMTELGIYKMFRDFKRNIYRHYYAASKLTKPFINKGVFSTDFMWDDMQRLLYEGYNMQVIEDRIKTLYKVMSKVDKSLTGALSKKRIVILLTEDDVFSSGRVLAHSNLEDEGDTIYLHMNLLRMILSPKDERGLKFMVEHELRDMLDKKHSRNVKKRDFEKYVRPLWNRLIATDKEKLSLTIPSEKKEEEVVEKKNNNIEILEEAKNTGTPVEFRMYDETAEKYIKKTAEIIGINRFGKDNIVPNVIIKEINGGDSDNIIHIIPLIKMENLSIRKKETIIIQKSLLGAAMFHTLLFQWIIMGGLIFVLSLFTDMETGNIILSGAALSSLLQFRSIYLNNKIYQGTHTSPREASPRDRVILGLLGLVKTAVFGAGIYIGSILGGLAGFFAAVLIEDSYNRFASVYNEYIGRFIENNIKSGTHTSPRETSPRGRIQSGSLGLARISGDGVLIINVMVTLVTSILNGMVAYIVDNKKTEELDGKYLNDMFKLPLSYTEADDDINNTINGRSILRSEKQKGLTRIVRRMKPLYRTLMPELNKDTSSIASGQIINALEVRDVRGLDELHKMVNDLLHSNGFKGFEDEEPFRFNHANLKNVINNVKQRIVKELPENNRQIKEIFYEETWKEFAVILGRDNRNLQTLEELFADIFKRTPPLEYENGFIHIRPAYINEISGDYEKAMRMIRSNDFNWNTVDEFLYDDDFVNVLAGFYKVKISGMEDAMERRQGFTDKVKYLRKLDDTFVADMNSWIKLLDDGIPSSQQAEEMPDEETALPGYVLDDFREKGSVRWLDTDYPWLATPYRNEMLTYVSGIRDISKKLSEKYEDGFIGVILSGDISKGTMNPETAFKLIVLRENKEVDKQFLAMLDKKHSLKSDNRNRIIFKSPSVSGMIFSSNIFIGDRKKLFNIQKNVILQIFQNNIDRYSAWDNYRYILFNDAISHENRFGIIPAKDENEKRKQKLLQVLRRVPADYYEVSLKYFDKYEKLISNEENRNYSVIVDKLLKSVKYPLYERLLGSLLQTRSKRKLVKQIDTAEPVFKELLRDTGVRSFKIDDQMKYDESTGTLSIEVNTAISISEVYARNKKYAKDITTILAAQEMNRDENSKVDYEEFMSALKGKIAGIWLVSLSLWFEMYTKGMIHSDWLMNRYVTSALKGAKPGKAAAVKRTVKSINMKFMAEKRIIKDKDTGAIGVAKEKKVARKIKRFILEFVSIIKNLKNIGTGFASMPTALAVTAATDGSVYTLSAYALGENRAKSLLDILMSAIADINNRNRDKDSTIINSFIMREILEQT
ncbi:glucosamine-6-phosphate deaminase [Elusimicrobiota bacterium]